MTPRPSLSKALVYGANGYTGSLIARLAAERGQRPILAGRDGAAVSSLATGLGMASRVFSLDDPATLDAGLADVEVVLHCAGPFSRTARPMADACLRRRVHYLDVTGEIAVFEAMAALNEQAKAAGIMLMPGVGFDVVPSDCLAAHLKRRLPTATKLSLGFQNFGRFSRGTATTMIENVSRGGVVRRGGKLVRVPACWRTRVIDFGRGSTIAMTIPWGDVSTAWHTTGIPEIEVYVAAVWQMRLFARLTRLLGPVLGWGPVQRWLKQKIRQGPAGPTDEQRARGASYLWGEASDPHGLTVTSRLKGPEGYTLTALTALAAVERVLEGGATPGFQTPGRAFGPDFVLGVAGIERRDV